MGTLERICSSTRMPCADVDLAGSQEAQRRAVAGADHQQVHLVLGGRVLAGGAARAAGVGRAGQRAEIEATAGPGAAASRRAVSTPGQRRAQPQLVALLQQVGLHDAGALRDGPPAGGWTAPRSTSETLKPSSCSTAAIFTPANEAPTTAARGGVRPRRRPPEPAPAAAAAQQFVHRLLQRQRVVEGLQGEHAPAAVPAPVPPAPRAARLWAAPPAWAPEATRQRSYAVGCRPRQW